MIKKVCLLFFTLMCLLVSSHGIAQAEMIILENGSRPYTFNHFGEKICFKVANGHLILANEDNTQKFLSVCPDEGAWVSHYELERVYSENPSNQFYVISAAVGAHGKNAGFWVVGKKDGSWVNLVTLDDLVDAGYTAEEWHRLRIKIDNEGDGSFTVISSHEYTPPGERLTLVKDAAFQLSWDSSAGDFVITRTF